MFTVMYVSSADPRVSRLYNPARLKTMELVTEFVPQFSFGIIPFEVRKYLQEQFPERDFSSKGRPGISLYEFCKERYAKVPEWQFYARRLLQSGGDDHGKFTRDRSCSAQRSLLSVHVTNNTQVLAKSREAALSRIFFEAEEFFQKMLERKDVSRGCGYAILRRMRVEEKNRGEEATFGIKEILDWFDYSSTDSRTVQRIHKESKLDLLRGDAAMLMESDGRYGLTPLSREAFALLEVNSEEIARFSYRTQWFYPYEKSPRALAERTERTVIKLQ